MYICNKSFFNLCTTSCPPSTLQAHFGQWLKTPITSLSLALEDAEKKEQITIAVERWSLLRKGACVSNIYIPSRITSPSGVAPFSRERGLSWDFINFKAVTFVQRRTRVLPYSLAITRGVDRPLYFCPLLADGSFSHRRS